MLIGLPRGPVVVLGDRGGLQLRPVRPAGHRHRRGQDRCAVRVRRVRPRDLTPVRPRQGDRVLHLQPTGERISQTKTPLTGGSSETSDYGLNPHTDVETLTNETGAASSTYRYTGYGSNDATGFTGKDKPTATSGPEAEPYNPYRFNSKRWNPATGGYDMGFRD